jgi:hypothetical protein
LRHAEHAVSRHTLAMSTVEQNSSDDATVAAGMGAATHMPVEYVITVQGSLDDHWSTWFEGLTISRGTNSGTALTGWIEDQAAHHGVRSGLTRRELLGCPSELIPS